MISAQLLSQNGLPPTLWVSGIVAALILWPVTVVLQNYFRLRHVPGPFWAQLSEFWITRKLWKGEPWTGIAEDLYHKYGDVVRFAPRSVLFSDPAAIPVIYGTKNVFRKGQSYEPAATLVNGKLLDSFVTTRDESRVSAIKRQINWAFTPNAVISHEAQVDETIKLVNKRIFENAPRLDLVRWLELFAFETICRIAFSDSNFTEQDVQDTLEGVKERFDHWVRWSAIPNVEKLLYKQSSFGRRMIPSSLTQRAMERVRERDAMGGEGSYSDLLNSYMRANTTAPEKFDKGTVVAMVISTIHAGAETTATTMLDALRWLLHNPTSLATLRKELEDANLASPPSFQSVAKLPYLEAVFKETMRMNALNVAPLDREVPPGGAHICGVYVPGGTSVAINVRGLALREDVWGPEAHLFRPERWFNADAATKTKMERAFPGFGYGKRMCIGEHIAWLEMKKLMPELLLNFEMKLVDPKATADYYSSIIRVPLNLWVEVTPTKRVLELVKLSK